MSSVPSAAAQVPHTQVEDPLQQYGKVLSLQSMGQQQQLDALQVQQAQQDQQDQAKFRQAYQAANGDPDKTVQLAAQSGVGPKLLVPFQQSILKYKQDLLNRSKDEQDFGLKQQDLIQGAVDKVKAAKPEDRPAVYQQQMQGLQKLNINTSQYPPQYPGDDHLPLIDAAVQGHRAMMEEAFKQSEQQEHESKATLNKTENEQKVAMGPSQLAASQAEATIKGNEASLGASSGPMADAQYRKILHDKYVAEGMSDQDATQKAYEQQKTIGPRTTFNLQTNGVGGDNGPKVNPDGTSMSADQMYAGFGGKQGTVKAIVEGRQSAPSSFAQKSPYWQDVMQKVYQVDPQWNEQRAQVRSHSPLAGTALISAT